MLHFIRMEILHFLKYIVFAIKAITAVFKEPSKFQLCLENAILKSEEYNLRLIVLLKNFKPFLLDLLSIVRHNLALRIVDGSSSLLYT